MNTRPRSNFASVACLSMSIALATAALANNCGQPGVDLAVGEISAATSYGATGDIAAYALGAELANAGSADASWVFSTPNHPVFTSNLYRIATVDGASRIEQIGMSWVYHEFFPLELADLCDACDPVGSGQAVGPGCTTPTSASLAGTQSRLGPRRQVNAHTGAFPYPPANPAFGGSLARRLQVHTEDFSAATYPGASFFAEVQIVSADDAANAHQQNNASYRRAIISSGGSWSLSFPGPTVVGVSVLDAWQATDPRVQIHALDVDDDGQLLVGASATEISPGVWAYEYAIQNLTCDRSVGSVSIPLPPNAVASEIGFHDVDYHSGDGLGDVTFSGADWDASASPGAVVWATETFDENPNANALRWGTLYNFRFVCNRPPRDGVMSLGLFKPGDAPAVLAQAPVPGSCAGDLDEDGAIGLPDLSILLEHFGLDADPLEGDLDGDGTVGLGDLSALLEGFGAGCP